MSRDQVNRICKALPGAEVSDPFGGGYDIWKVGGKIFAGVGPRDDHGVSVKCADIDTAEMLIAAGFGQKAPYFHRSWVNLPSGAGEDELRHRILASCRLIRSGLTKKAQAALPPLDP